MAKISNRMAKQILAENNYNVHGDGSLVNDNTGETVFICTCGCVFECAYPLSKDGYCPDCGENMYFSEANTHELSIVFEQLKDEIRD